jgi:hypothetical protein
VKPYDWSSSKNAKLKAERSVSFEDILIAIDEDRILAIIEHPNKLRYGHQKIYVINIRDYAYLVPYVEDNEKIFLKTIIPSRRATKKYLKGEL